MAQQGKIGAKAALLMAACSGLAAGALAQTQPAPMAGMPVTSAPAGSPSAFGSVVSPPAAVLNTTQPASAASEAGWGEMTLDELAGLIGARLPRPMRRPDGFAESIDYGDRPRPRPMWLLAEAPIDAAPPQGGSAVSAPEPASVVDAVLTPAVGPMAVAEAGSASASPAPAEVVSAPMQVAELTPVAGLQPAAPLPVIDVASINAPAAEPSKASEAAAPVTNALQAPPAAASGPLLLPTADAAATGAEPQAAGATRAAEIASVNLIGPPTTEDAAAKADAEPLVDPLPRLTTTGFARESYIRDRATREAVFIAAEGEAKIAAALDLSRFLIAHLLLPEARAYHLRAQGMGVQLHPELHRIWRVQSVMLDVLQHRKPSQPMPEGWADSSLWTIAGRARPGLIAGSPDLAEAIAALQHHSEPVISRLLPELFDAALAAGDLHSADMLLRGAREATTLTAEPVYHLMMGRLALAYDLPEDAFDYFAKAADGRDIAAQRARIAMADLAIARKDPRLLPALAEILSEGVHQWRYGAEGLILRARLAQVAEDLGDIPLALDIMGRIRQDHPGTAEAILAHERGALALAAFAVAVDAGEIGLETYLQSLREVESFYRLDPVWPIARSALGRAWSRAGLHSAAAAEYAALQGDLQRVGAPTPPEAQRAAIPLDEAEALLENHDEARARIALARDGLPKFSDLGHRYAVAALKAKVTGAVSTTAAFDTADDLFTHARAARAANQHSVAHQAHRALLLQNGLARDPAEALHAALIARDLGAPDFATQSLDDLRKGPLGATGAAAEPLGTALLEPMPKLAPLSQDIADVMLSRSGAAIAATEALLSRPLLSPEDMAAWEAGRRAAPDAEPQPQTLPRGADASPATSE